MKKLALIITVCLTMVILQMIFGPSIGFAEKEYRIKFATVAPEGSTWMKYMRTLDKTLREKSQGQIGFSLYPGGVAGDELDVLRKIRIGQLHCAAFSGVGIAQILPMVRVLDLPFLFKTQEEITLVQNELYDYFISQFREKGFEFLSWAEVGDVHLFSKSPIRTVSDVAGLKVWTWSGDPISKETFMAMGTNPIPLSITDVNTALNTGMIDTVYAPPLGALALQWHRYVKYMTRMPLTHATGTVLISNQYFTKIPKDLADLLKVELKHTMGELTHDLIQQTNEAIQLIQESGVEIIPIPPPAEMEAFLKIHEQVAQKLAGNQYPQELLDRIYKILERSSKKAP